ncbi:MAG: YCF48-related protein [Planctomycetota bacterium]
MKGRILILVVGAALAALLSPVADLSARPRLAGHFKAVIHDTDASLYQVRYFEDGGVYACGADGWFVFSEDHGKSWDSTQVKEGVSLKVMNWPSRRTLILAGRDDGKNFVWRSTDRGAMFSPKHVDTDLPIRGYAFLGLTKGFMVAGSVKSKDGTWRVSKDGGATFAKIDSVAYGNPARALMAISRAGKKSLFAVGGHVELGYVGESAKSLLYRKKKGGVLRSTDEGRTWEVLDAGNAAGTRLYDVDFFDEKHGWVVGEKGFAAMTADAGKTWTKVATNTTERLNAVQMIEQGVVYMVGENGVARGTVDGETVVTFRTDTKRDLRDLSFTSEHKGFVVGTSGTVLRFVREF